MWGCIKVDYKKWADSYSGDIENLEKTIAKKQAEKEKAKSPNQIMMINRKISFLKSTLRDVKTYQAILIERGTR